MELSGEARTLTRLARRPLCVGWFAVVIGTWQTLRTYVQLVYSA